MVVHKLLRIFFLSWICYANAGGFEDLIPLYPNSGMLNVKDFGAKGDGLSDDLPAIKAALNKALKDNSRYSRPPFIYFPAGTYLVSDTLEGRVDEKWSNGWRSGVMLMGERRSAVTIKIKDKHPKFQDPKTPRPVIITGSEDPRKDGGGNRAFRHNIFNLTVSTGSGNPGAKGIDYICNNRGAIRNVTIRTEDGEGVVGLDMSREWPGPALIKNVIIEGFDIGIRSDRHGQYSMTFHNIMLRNQNKVGIDNKQNGLFFENLISENRVPVIFQNRHENGLIVVIGGRFTGGSNVPAIQNTGSMLLRDINVEGYSAAATSTVGKQETIVAPGKVAGWVSEKALGRGDGKQLRLPIKQSPEYVSDDPSQWQNAAEFLMDGAEDQTDGIQKALNSGKPVVYFPNGGYTIRKTLVVPPSVRKITGFQSSINADDKFRGEILLSVKGSGEPLIVEHLWFSRGAKKEDPSKSYKRVEQNSSRSVVFRHVDIHGGYSNTRNGNGDVFFEDTMGVPLRINHPQSVWGRQVNCEFISDAPMIQSKGATVWIMGYKTEGQQTIFAGDGGRVEILGGLAYALGGSGQKYDRHPMFSFNRTQSAISIIGNGSDWTTLVDESTGPDLISKDAPRRGRASRVTLYRN